MTRSVAPENGGYFSSLYFIGESEMGNLLLLILLPQRRRDNTRKKKEADRKIYVTYGFP